jgi:ketosteroid isomerase-like protein
MREAILETAGRGIAPREAGLRTAKEQKMEDVIVIGGSYAGMAAALQLLRARRRVAVIDARERRNLFASHSHGFLGQDGIDPAQLWAEAQRQLLAYMTLRWVDGVADLMAAPVGDGLAMAFDGEAIWRQNWIGFFGMFDDDLVITIDDLTVYQQGDLATVRGLTRLEGTLVGGPFVDMWVRETNVLRGVDDRWLVLHDHVSVPFGFATGQALTSLGPIGR